MKISLAIGLAFLLATGACGSDDGRHDSGSATKPATEGPMRSTAHAFPGFAVYEADGRLWIFREGSAGQMEFDRRGEPAESVTMVGAGPDRMTIKSDRRETLLAYTSTKPGFRVFAVDGRLWVFREGSEALADYFARGLPAECATRVGAGPRRETLRSHDLDTIEAYLAAWR